MKDITTTLGYYPRIKHVKLELDGVLAVGRSHGWSEFVSIGAPEDFRVLLNPEQVATLIATLQGLQARINSGVSEDGTPPIESPLNPTNTLEAYSLLGKIARKLGV